MNQAFYADFEFDEYASKDIRIKEAHDSFMKFLDANIMEINPVLIDKSLQAIEKVAGSFRKVNKKERIMIDKVKAEIEEIAELFRSFTYREE